MATTNDEFKWDDYLDAVDCMSNDELKAELLVAYPMAWSKIQSLTREQVVVATICTRSRLSSLSAVRQIISEDPELSDLYDVGEGVRFKWTRVDGPYELIRINRRADTVVTCNTPWVFTSTAVAPTVPPLHAVTTGLITALLEGVTDNGTVELWSDMVTSLGVQELTGGSQPFAVGMADMHAGYGGAGHVSWLVQQSADLTASVIYDAKCALSEAYFADLELQLARIATEFREREADSGMGGMCQMLRFWQQQSAALKSECTGRGARS